MENLSTFRFISAGFALEGDPAADFENRYVWFCLAFCVFSAMCMGFLIGFADRPPLVAICVVFLFFLCF